LLAQARASVVVTVLRIVPAQPVGLFPAPGDVAATTPARYAAEASLVRITEQAGTNKSTQSILRHVTDIS
jgi:hypothetical protein